MIWRAENAKVLHVVDFDSSHEHSHKNFDILGEIWGKTIESFLQNFTINWEDDSCDGSALVAKNVEQWLLMGDPSLKIGGYPT